LIFNLLQIPDDNRLPEKQFWANFERVQPRIFGALLDAVSAGLKNYKNIQLSSLPRMADFAIWISACEPALPWPPGAFMAAYTGNRQEAVEITLEADVVATAVRAFMAERGEWAGTATDLLEALRKHVPGHTIKNASWPKAPHTLSGRLKRAATFLRQVDLDIEWGKSGSRKIAITRRSKQNSAQSVQSANPMEIQGFLPTASKIGSVPVELCCA
jgi:hypothetical protein